MKKAGRRPTTPLFEVRRSRVHGDGVFALRRIRKGTNIIEYLGERVRPELADARYAGKASTDGHTFLFTVDARTVIDAGVNGNEARFVNHGCDPNCQTVQMGKRIFIEATRTIRAGEELAYDYRIQRDADDPPDIDIVFACRCGARNCRGSMLVTPRKKRAAPPKKRTTPAKKPAKHAKEQSRASKFRRRAR